MEDMNRLIALQSSMDQDDEEIVEELSETLHPGF